MYPSINNFNKCVPINLCICKVRSIIQSKYALKINKPQYNADNKIKVNIKEDIKSRLKLGNACYYSVQNLLSSSLLSKKLKIKIYRNIILPVVLYGCETWSLTLKEERRLSVFENRVLR